MSSDVQPGRARRRASIGDRILSTALREIMRQGAAKVSMADIAEAAQVSRTTLYKYFPIKEDLLLAVGAHIRLLFENELEAAIAGRDDPRDRLVAVLDFQRRFHDEWQAEQIINLELGPIIEGIRLNFDHYCALIATALTPTFDALEAMLGHPVPRRILTETLIRIQLSNAIIRLSREWEELPTMAGAAWNMLAALAASTATPQPAPRRKRA